MHLEEARAPHREEERALERARTQEGAFWQAILDDADLHSFLVDIVCDLLVLAPRPHWWEALRLRWVPRIPECITLTDPQVWKRTEESFVQNRVTEMDCLHAASQLLVDVWLWLVESHDTLEQSPFANLAQLTRDIDSPPLRVAHCIRDLAYGDESREKDLIAMVNSKDPRCRQLFVDAFWREA